jgi:hypothetical protein
VRSLKSQKWCNSVEEAFDWYFRKSFASTTVSSVSSNGHPKSEAKGKFVGLEIQTKARTEKVGNCIDGKKTSFNDVEIEVQRVECG